uniref:N-acyl-phosphatidylethanolamine-hydrolyzing phospholipase D-like isoform X2 n=1 Tax=Myxine glutinosa TaxID=7769 RepID=UPI00358F5986
MINILYVVSPIFVLMSRSHDFSYHSWLMIYYHAGVSRHQLLRRMEDSHPKEDATCSTVVHAPKMMMTISEHKSDGRFVNPWPTWKQPSLFNLLQWKLMERNHNRIPHKEELDRTLPIRTPYFMQSSCDTSVLDGNLRVTWLGHASTLVELDGTMILTDPMFSKRASPSLWFGPSRYRDAPCDVDQLPENVRAVVISHNHYDHLDYNTVINLNQRFGDALHWFVPLGLASWMRASGCKTVTELDWWQEELLPGTSVSLAATPCQHWSRRTISDENRTLWASWCLLGPKHRVFFAGDTGYCSGFQQIGHRYGPFDIALIPIGAYAPRWFLKFQHVNPEEAVHVHQDVLARHSLGIHWGTFPLSDEHYLEPREELERARERHGLTEEDFFVLEHGASWQTSAIVSAHRDNL